VPARADARVVVHRAEAHADLAARLRLAGVQWPPQRPQNDFGQPSSGR
jgi:hypothetical protein